MQLHNLLWGGAPNLLLYTPELSAQNISQCVSNMTCVIDKQDSMTTLTSVGVWIACMSVIVKTSALNKNVDTASSNYW